MYGCLDLIDPYNPTIYNDINMNEVYITSMYINA